MVTFVKPSPQRPVQAPPVSGVMGPDLAARHSSEEVRGRGYWPQPETAAVQPCAYIPDR